LEEVRDLIERRREVEDERVVLQVVEVVHLLEGGDEHPVHGEAREHDEDREEGPEPDFLTDLSVPV